MSCVNGNLCVFLLDVHFCTYKTLKISVYMLIW